MFIHILLSALTVCHATSFIPPTDINVWDSGENLINLPGSQLTDVNGDGLPDFVQAYVDSTGTKPPPLRHVWLNNGKPCFLSSQEL